MSSSKKDLVKMERVLKGGHGDDDVYCVTSTKTYVITGGNDHKAVVWERGGAGKIVRTLEGHTGVVECLDTTPCEKYVVTGSWDNTLILWKLSNGNRERSFVGHTDEVLAVAVTPSGDGIVSGSDDNTAILWNIHDGSRLLTFKGHKHCVFGVVVSSSGLHLYTCSYDHTAVKWSMKTGERLDTFRGHGDSVYSCCLTSDDKYFITASRDKTVIVWNADDTTRLRTLKGHSKEIESVCVSSSAPRIVATGSWDNTVILWDFQTAKPMCTLKDHKKPVQSVHISKDNRHLFSASNNGTAVQYDISKLFKDIPTRFALLHCLRSIRSSRTATGARPAVETSKKRERNESAMSKTDASDLHPGRTIRDVELPKIGDLHRAYDFEGERNVSDCEVLIRVRTSSVNPSDIEPTIARYPKILGSDVAGIVEAVGHDCRRFGIGSKVYGDIGANTLRGKHKTKELGAYAEYALALESQLGRVPSTWSWAEAGALPKVALTSYKALAWYANATKWKRPTTVLILGGSGGTGTTAIQLARYFGAEQIWTTTSSANAKYCESLGATRVIDYHSEQWWDPSIITDETVDVVYDCVGEEGTADRAMRVLKSPGYFVTIAGSLSEHPKAGVSQSFFINSDTNLVSAPLLDRLTAIAESGGLAMPRIFQTFPLSNITGAFDVSAQGHVVGKISVDVEGQ
eukprot:g2066.t1